MDTAPGYAADIAVWLVVAGLFLAVMGWGWEALIAGLAMSGGL